MFRIFVGMLMIAGMAGCNQHAIETVTPVPQRQPAPVSRDFLGEIAKAMQPGPETDRVAAQYANLSTVEALVRSYEDLAAAWKYVPDPPGELVRTAESTFATATAGDCEDFAIAIMALLKSLPGGPLTSRILIVEIDRPWLLHAFAQVLIAESSADEVLVRRVMERVWRRPIAPAHHDPEGLWYSLDFVPHAPPAGRSVRAIVHSDGRIITSPLAGHIQGEPSMLCMSCRNELAPDAPVCQFCGFSLDTVPMSLARNVTVSARPRAPVIAELVLAFDRSGSMNPFNQGNYRSCQIMLPHIAAKALAVKCFVRTHSDEDYGEMPHVICDGGSPEEALQSINTIRYQGGGDALETHLSALEDAVTMTPWTNDLQRARGALIAFITADSKPARSGHSVQQIAQEMIDRNILFYLIAQPGCKLMRQLCDAAGGMFVQISNSPSARELKLVADKVAQSVVLTIALNGTKPLMPTTRE